mgnify:CR=1 FL=1
MRGGRAQAQDMVTDMKLKLLSAAVLAAGLMFGMGATAPQAEAGVRIYIGTPGYYYGYPRYYRYGYPRYYRVHSHRHCHRYKVWRHGHRVWVRKCHRHRHGAGHH